MIKTAQRKMLRLIVQTKRKIQIEKTKKEVMDETAEDTKKYEQEEKSATDKETEKGSDQNSDKDQNSDVSFQEHIEEATDTTEMKKTGLNTLREVPKKQKIT